MAQVTTRDLGVIGEELRALLLNKLAVRIIVLVCDVVLLHHIIVQELR